MERFSRTQMLLGKQSILKLNSSAVAVFGLGGVGSFTVEALARSGVGKFALFDNDTVCISNINRQLIATGKTVGRKKVEIMRERILEINPQAQVDTFECFYGPQNADAYDLTVYDYIVDAVDTVTAKLTLIEQANKAGVPVISCMGAGNKLDPSRFEVADINKTSVCPLAKVMRRELKKRGIGSLKVVYSKEPPIQPVADEEDINCTGNKSSPVPQETGSSRRQTPGSVAFVPSVAGLILAGEVVKDLTGVNV